MKDQEELNRECSAVVATELHQHDHRDVSSSRTCKSEETVCGPNDTIKDSYDRKCLFDEEERLLAGAVLNSTARKQQEEHLQRVRFAMDHAMDAVYWIDPQARILYTNQAASEMLGYTADEFLHMTVHDLNPDFPPEVWPGFWAETREKKELSLETVHLAKEGRRIPIDIRVSFLAYDGQEFHCAYVRDITARKEAETALRQVHEQLERRVEERTAQLAMANQSLQTEIIERKRVEDRLQRTQHAVDHAADQIFIIGSNGYFIDANESACRRLGYTKEELMTMSVMDIDPEFPKSAWEAFWAEFSNLKRVRLETWHRSRSGEIYPVEVVANYLLQNGQELDYAIVRDISERKEMDLRLARHAQDLERQVAERTVEIAKLESQRAHTEKLAAVGRLAAGVAHEINNPIAGIKNAFALVKQAIDPVHPNAKFAGMIDREIARVASIVQNMYQLYRPESSRGEPVELQTVMNDIRALLAKQLEQRRLILVTDVEPGFARLNLPRRDLLHVLLNLMANAIDGSVEGGTITLTVGAEPNVIRIAVSDQGVGIPPENLPLIFDPFFTTKTGRDQKGMGLGLSISQSLVMAMGGRIEVASQPNNGSTFSILLPRHIAVTSPQGQAQTIKEVVPHDR